MYPVLYLIVILISILILWAKWKLTYWQRRGVHVIEPNLIFGNSKKTMLGQQSFAEASREKYEYGKRKNLKYIGNYQFHNPTFIPIDLELVKNILVRDFNHFTDHGMYHHPKDTLTMHLFNLEGTSWQSLRKKLTPTFTSGKMRMMFETLVEKTHGLERVVETHADLKAFLDIKEILGRFTTDVIASCAFGIECNSLDDPDNQFRLYGKKVFQPNIPMFLIIQLLPTGIMANLGIKRFGRDVWRFFSKVVLDTIKTREEKEIFRKDFMHLLLELKNRGFTSSDGEVHHLTEDKIIAQCFVFFLAGFETSSTTMTFALLSLSVNQDIQDKLRQEINGVLDNNEGEITYNAIMEMKYLDRVVDETLRRYPPAASLIRRCNSDYKVPNSNVVIKKGQGLSIPVWGIHMDPEYYPDPEKFDPERFNDDVKASRPDFTFLPFGEGPRQCIGLRFGIMQAKVGLVSLIRNFKFTLNEKTRMPIAIQKGSAVLSVEGGVWLDVERVRY